MTETQQDQHDSTTPPPLMLQAQLDGTRQMLYRYVDKIACVREVANAGLLVFGKSESVDGKLAYQMAQKFLEVINDCV